MEEIIKKAIEGGYMEGASVKYDPDDKKIFLIFSDGTESDFINWSDIVISPTFWQFLGKACGWGNNKVLGSHGITERDTWLHYAKFFHEINLTESFEKAVEYLKSIVVK